MGTEQPSINSAEVQTTTDMTEKSLHPTWLMLVMGMLSFQGRSGKVAMLYYGKYGGIQLNCGADELIMIESQVLGYSDNAPDCSPTVNCSRPYTLGKWYCRGKTSSCTGMQVERWPLIGDNCPSSFTNCLRIEYQCVKGETACTILTMK